MKIHIIILTLLGVAMTCLAAGSGTFSDADPKGPGRELTLIESEVLAALESDHGVRLTSPGHLPLPEKNKSHLLLTRK